MKLTRQFTRREQVLLVILALVSLFAVYFLVVHLPVTEALERAQAEKEAISTNMMVLEAKQKRMDQMQKELDAILAQPNVAEIPDYDNLQQVIDFLDTVLSTTGEYSLSFRGLQRAEDTGILRREIQMTFVSASYYEARDVLEQLQNCPFRCQLSAMGITLASGQAPDTALTDGAVQVSLTVTFFENAR